MSIIHKKNLIINYKNLPDEARELFKERYPEGYSDYLQRTVKPNGESIFTVPLETAETNYLVKFDVKVDSGMVEEDDDYLSDDAPKSDDAEFVPLSEALDKEEGISSGIGPLRHGGDYEDFLDDIKSEGESKKNKTKHSVEDAEEDCDAEEAEDDYRDNYEDNEDEEEMDDPSDEELLGIDEFTQGILNDDLSDLGIKDTAAKRRATQAKEEKSKGEQQAKTVKCDTKNNAIKKDTLKDIMGNVEDRGKATKPQIQAAGKKTKAAVKNKAAVASKVAAAKIKKIAAAEEASPKKKSEQTPNQR